LGGKEAGKQWRRRLVFLSDYGAGQTIYGPGNVRTARCGEGLEPDELDKVLGKRLRAAVRAGDPVTKECFG
jgi:sialic acid synthase SpsE